MTAAAPSEGLAPQAVLDPELPWPSFAPYLNRLPAAEAGAETIDEPGALTPEPRSTVPLPASKDIVRVALLLPLTGPNAGLGSAMLNAAQLAMFNFADKRFELLTHDTKGTPRGAADAARLAATGRR